MGLLSMLLGLGCESVTPGRVRSMLENGGRFTLVDVRTPREHAAGSIKGALHIPLHDIGGRTGEIPRDREVVLFCQNGIRSIMACRILKKQGFANVRNMSGGMSRW